MNFELDFYDWNIKNKHVLSCLGFQKALLLSGNSKKKKVKAKYSKNSARSNELFLQGNSTNVQYLEIKLWNKRDYVLED